MIKRFLSIGLILLFVMAVTAPGYCEGENQEGQNGRIKKLGRGLCNMATFPLEIAEQTARINNTDGPLAAVTVGLLKGVVCAVGRV